MAVSGSRAAFSGFETRTDTGPVADAPGTTRLSITELAFNGTLAGDTVNGTLKYSERSTFTGGDGGAVNETALGSFALALRRSP
jgi:hypothetical protein